MRGLPLFIGGVLVAAAAGLFLWRAGLDWPAGAGDRVGRVLLLDSLLPRAAVALIAGAALGLAGALMQQVLRNPIADPTTLGIAAGAQLALTVATVYVPGAVAVAREPVAFLGGSCALAVMLAVTWRRGLDPVTVVVCGMLFSIVAASLSAAIVLSNGDYLLSLAIWGGGALGQQSWVPTIALGWRLVLAAAAAAVLIRPLKLLGLDEAGARALGLGVGTTRLAALALAVGLSSSVTAFVGVIGFVGLAAPNLARIAGARTLGQVLIVAPLVGGLLLWLTDGIVHAPMFASIGLLPAGSATALLGGPLLLWLLPRLRRTTAAPEMAMTIVRRAERPGRLLGLLAVVLAVVLVVALCTGRGPGGWNIATQQSLALVAPWRWPRIVAAAAAGAMLSAAGYTMQRITANPMASPEVLGVGAGAGVGLAAVLLCIAGAGEGVRLAGAFVGAGGAFVVAIGIAARNRFAAERLLLAGLAVGAFGTAVVGIVIARGDAAGLELLGWLSGTTARIDASQAIAVAVVALIFVPPLALLSRWFRVLPLGGATAQAVGLSPARATGVLVLIAALLTACATLVVGPVSFVGLMAPHIARGLGVPRPSRQLAAATLIGALVMVVADWLARTLAFPYEMPTGLFASLIGAPYLIWLLNRAGK